MDLKEQIMNVGTVKYAHNKGNNAIMLSMLKNSRNEIIFNRF